MPLSLLPDLKWPITPKQSEVLLANAVQMSFIDAGLNDSQQRALGILFDIYDVLARSKGMLDYRGKEGNARLYADATAFAGSGSPLVTRQGDLKAAHLAIDYHDTQRKLLIVGMPGLSDDVQKLVSTLGGLVALAAKEDDRISLYLRYVLKK
jgi:hypothetical protein